mmetsp:Transcript_22776/g.51540  ORF Transcript_22776/g.51540 Transcript_22776/m.51540 type:complete len:211 (-) Transcript_22776:102-734(-)
MERIITFVSKPRPWMKPAHSSATYDAPTVSVFPGGVLMEKMSSELMPCSFAPGMSRYLGRPPTAMTNLSAVIVVSLPFLSTATTVFASLNVAKALKYLTDSLISSARYPKLSDLTCICTAPTMSSHLCFGTSGMSQPYSLASFMASPNCAAWCISFFGMQPTFTHVPPKPQVVPAGEGLTKSQTATFFPSLAAFFEHASPPEPPPITSRS